MSISHQAMSAPSLKTKVSPRLQTPQSLLPPPVPSRSSEAPSIQEVQPLQESRVTPSEVINTANGCRGRANAASQSHRARSDQPQEGKRRKSKRGSSRGPAMPLALLQEPPADEPQRKILEWAEHLHKELTRSEKERAAIEKKLAEAQAERVRLRMELEKFQRHSAELERHTSQGKTASDAFTENGDLRKQLAAYAVEIERLREEKESCRVAHSMSEQVCQQLSIEKEELEKTHKELIEKHKSSLQECDRLADLHGTEREHRARAESQLEQRKDALDASLAAAQASMNEEYEKACESLKEAERSHREKDERVRGLAEIVSETMGVVAELQENFVQQTKAYSQLSKQVRSQQEELLRDVKEAEQLALHSEQFAGDLKRTLSHAKDMNVAGEDQWKREANRLQDQLHQMTEHHRSAAKQIRDFRQADDVRAVNERRRAEEEKRLAAEKEKKELEKKVKSKGRHHLLNNPAIHKQMHQAVSGIEVEKVDQRGRREKRRLKVICGFKWIRSKGIEHRVPDMQLRWSKAPFKEWPDRSSCDLEQVISLGYGFAARAWWLFPDKVTPQCCFSLNTPNRSFDFVCSSEWDAEVMVTVISRLCTRIQGWPLLGGVQSHARFLCMKGWTKVQAACRKSRNTLCTHLLEVAAKTKPPLRASPAAQRSLLPLPPTDTVPHSSSAPRAQSEEETFDDEEEEEEEEDETDDEEVEVQAAVAAKSVAKPSSTAQLPQAGFQTTYTGITRPTLAARA